MGLIAPEVASEEPETILPPSCLVAAATWEVETLIRDAHRTQPDPGNGPPNRLFVPDCEIPGAAVGTLIKAHLSLWFELDTTLHPSALLDALHVL